MNLSKDGGRQSVGSVVGGAGAASNAGQGTTMINTGAPLAAGPNANSLPPVSSAQAKPGALPKPPAPVIAAPAPAPAVPA